MLLIERIKNWFRKFKPITITIQAECNKKTPLYVPLFKFYCLDGKEVTEHWKIFIIDVFYLLLATFVVLTTPIWWSIDKVLKKFNRKGLIEKNRKWVLTLQLSSLFFAKSEFEKTLERR